MNTSPISFSLRLALKIITLVIFGYWGWCVNKGMLQYAAVIALPLIAASLWSAFSTVNYPPLVLVKVPGIVKLLTEWVLFSLAVLALFSLRCFTQGVILGILIKVQYVLSYERTWAMIRNKPTGFKEKGTGVS
jgi:hypothetical protein